MVVVAETVVARERPVEVEGRVVVLRADVDERVGRPVGGRVLAAPESMRIVRPVLSRTAAWIGRSARWPQNASVLALVMTNVVFVPSGKLAVPWNVSVPVECMIVPAVIVL